MSANTSLPGAILSTDDFPVEPACYIDLQGTEAGSNLVLSMTFFLQS